ncbi:MAG: glycosyltransferase family 4 protein [Mycobacterium sp.]
MRVTVHDYSGHPGQVHLSRELVRRGHTVEHQYCSSYTTGRGATELRDDDSPAFSISAISLGREFARYAPSRRIAQEIRYGRNAARSIIKSRPDVAVLSNVPLLALLILAVFLRIRNIRFVFWQQDIYCDAIRAIALQRLGSAGRPIGWLATLAERWVARNASSIIAISPSFIEELDSWKIPRSKVSVIPNWAAIDEMPARPRDNEWAKSHGLLECCVAMYAGNLGLKHDPSLLAMLADSAPPDAKVVVVSQGRGREWLEENADDIPALELLDYQPYDVVPNMLASADVLIVVLERDASRYSVPSKVLNYLCAGRPVLALLPGDNGVAHMLREAGAGIVIDPANREAAKAALQDLMLDASERARMGTAARRYAEDTFDVTLVGDRVEVLLKDIVSDQG